MGQLLSILQHENVFHTVPMLLPLKESAVAASQKLKTVCCRERATVYTSLFGDFLNLIIRHQRSGNEAELQTLRAYLKTCFKQTSSNFSIMYWEKGGSKKELVI